MQSTTFGFTKAKAEKMAEEKKNALLGVKISSFHWKLKGLVPFLIVKK